MAKIGGAIHVNNNPMGHDSTQADHVKAIRKRFKKAWRDPVKGKAPNPETLAIEGSFEKFTADMKRLFSRPKTEKKIPI